MKRLLVIAALAILCASPAPAQRVVFSDGSSVPVPPKQDKPLDAYVAAREKLIKRYTALGGLAKTNGYAWGVAICGGQDIFTGADNSWLTVYLYKDSVTDFAADFDQFATKTRGGSLTVDGITVVIQVIPRTKSKTTRNKINVQPKSASERRADSSEYSDGAEDFSEIC